MRTDGAGGTYVDANTASNAVATLPYYTFQIPVTTLAATNSGVTTSTASSLFVTGPPAAGNNQTITNPYSLYVQTGSSRLNGPLVLSQSSTAKTVSLVTASSTSSTYTLTLPTSVPATTGQALISDTSGTLSWGNSGGAATQSSFSAANNVTTAANVTGLTVSASPTIIPIYVSLSATTSLFAITTIRVYYNSTGSTYVLESNSAGDTTGVRFDVTSSGQIVYYSGNYAGFSSLTFTWYAPFTPVASATSSLSLTNSLSVGTNTTLGGSAVSGTSSSSSGGLFFLQGTTFTDSSTAASGTAASFNAAYIAAPTLAATNTSVTTTTASTLTVAGSPVAGTNNTIGTAYAFSVLNGTSNFAGPVMFPGGIYANAITTQPVPQLRCCGGFYVPSGGTAVSLTNGAYNVASIVRNSVGNFTINFTKPIQNYVVTTGFCRVGTSDFINVYSPSSNLVYIEFWSGGATKDPINFPGIMFTIMS